MSLTTKENLNIILQVVKKLLSSKIDRSELPNSSKAIEIAAENGLIDPIVSDDGFIFADENGVIYSL